MFGFVVAPPQLESPCLLCYVLLGWSAAERKRRRATTCCWSVFVSFDALELPFENTPEGYSYNIAYGGMTSNPRSGSTIVLWYPCLDRAIDSP